MITATLLLKKKIKNIALKEKLKFLSWRGQRRKSRVRLNQQVPGVQPPRRGQPGSSWVFRWWREVGFSCFSPRKASSCLNGNCYGLVKNSSYRRAGDDIGLLQDSLNKKFLRNVNELSHIKSSSVENCIEISLQSPGTGWVFLHPCSCEPSGWASHSPPSFPPCASSAPSLDRVPSSSCPCSPFWVSVFCFGQLPFHEWGTRKSDTKAPSPARNIEAATWRDVAWGCKSKLLLLAHKLFCVTAQKLLRAGCGLVGFF